MGRFFDLDNGFFRFMGKAFDMIVLNVITLVMCLPIVTIGPAITAFYYVGMKIVRDEEGYAVKGYFKSFKENFKQGFLLELITSVVAVIAFVDLRVAYQWMQQDGGTALKLLFYALVGLTMVAIAAFVYIFPVLAKFENSTKRILVLSAVIAIKHLPQTVFMIVVYGAMGVAIYIYPICTFFIVAFAVAVNSIILRRIFDNYIKVDSEGRIITEEVAKEAGGDADSEVVGEDASEVSSDGIGENNDAEVPSENE